MLFWSLVLLLQCALIIQWKCLPCSGLPAFPASCPALVGCMWYKNSGMSAVRDCEEMINRRATDRDTFFSFPVPLAALWKSEFSFENSGPCRIAAAELMLVCFSEMWMRASKQHRRQNEHQQWRTTWAGGLGHLQHLCSYRLIKPSVMYLNEHFYGESPFFKFVSRMALKRHFALFARLQLRITDQWLNPDTDDLLMLSNSFKIFRTLIL